MSNPKTSHVAFDRFLAVARGKPAPQRILLVFAEKQLREEEGAFGNLPSPFQDFSVNPLMYTDKAIEEIPGFNHLRQDSLKNGTGWDLLYVSALDEGRFSRQAIDQRLELMVKLIHQGVSDKFVIFNQQGELAQFAKVTVQ